MDRRSPSTVDPSARAYCRPAHGRCWTVEAPDGRPAAVELDEGDPQARYHLVHHPRTRRPVRDYRGNDLDMPVRYGLDA